MMEARREVVSDDEEEVEEFEKIDLPPPIPQPLDLNIEESKEGESSQKLE
jgi:hypothetical protein